VFSTLGDYLQVENWRILRGKALASNSVSNWEKLLRRLFRYCNRLMERIVWAVRMLAVIRQNVPRVRQSIKSLPKPPEAFEGGSAKEEAWGMDKQHLGAAPWQCTCSRVTPYPWIFYEAWDDCCPPATLLSIFGHCGLFFVPEVEILTKRWPISDGRGDRRKFATGPSRHPAKHVPGRFPELEKSLGAVCQEWRGVLWRRQVWLSCK